MEISRDNNQYGFLNIPYIDDDTFEKDSSYTFNGFHVPRVTQIIESCEDQSNLVRWAANITYRMYKNIKDKALIVGTAVHYMIDNYIRYCLGESKTEDDYPFNYWEFSPSYKETVDIAYYNFKAWYEEFKKNGYQFTRIWGLEVPLICNLYGGTADAIVQINDKYNYILDFKTSKEINYNYLLQVAAYDMIINSGFKPDMPHIDGVGIIRVDKQIENVFNDIFMHEEYSNIDYYKQCFLSMVETYYRLKSSTELSKQYYAWYSTGEFDFADEPPYL